MGGNDDSRCARVSDRDRRQTGTNTRRRTGCGDGHCHAVGGRTDGVSRRTVLAGTVGAAAWLAGCGGNASGDEVPEPVTLDQSDQCDVCGMVIPNHPGPSAQIFYRDQRPSSHDNPARFCSTWEAFQYDFERQDRGWRRAVFYVTDYSAVEYELTRDGGDTLVSTHPEAGAFVDATAVTFVVGSEVKGAMGRDLIGFSDRADAEAFRDDHGGDLTTFDAVDRDTIALLASS
jgi:nitrous oxide reductase accessory protein NosL